MKNPIRFRAERERERPIRLGLVGDVMLGELLENYRNGVRDAIVRKGVDPFRFAHETLSGFDLNIANLECPVSDSSCRKGFFREILRVPGKFAEILENAPFHVLGLANNHVLDHGREALRNCVSNVQDRGILVFGVENGRIRQTRPVEVSIGGNAFHLWAFNLSNLDKSELRKRMDHIRGCLNDTREKDCRVILYLHWGEEYTDAPPTEICRLAFEFSEIGVGFVIGHHSHRLQGVARIGETVFAPSLGNFVFDDRRKDGLLTAILELSILDGGSSSWRMIPFSINSDFQPIPDAKRESEIEKLHAKLATQLEAIKTGGVSLDNEVSRTVALGHKMNRIRMRLLMMAGFSRYAGAYSEIVKYVIGRGGEGFSVSDECEWHRE